MSVCAPSLLCILLVLFTFRADGYYGQSCMRCYYSSNFSAIEFTYSWYFNKDEHVRYNSTTKKFNGYTHFGVKEAELMNQDPANSLNVYLFTFCQDYADRYSSKVLKTMKPKVMMRSLRPESGVLLAMLMCTVYDYYPKGVTVSWLRNGEVVTEGVSSTDELSDGDWFYQIHTYLEYTPRPGENISCMVQHESLTQPLISTWDPALPVDERNKLIIGIFFLVLGIVSAVAGFLYYMLRCKRCPAKQTSPQTSMRLVSTVSVASSEASNP